MTASSDSSGSELDFAPVDAEMFLRSLLEEGRKEAEGGGGLQRRRRLLGLWW